MLGSFKERRDNPNKFTLTVQRHYMGSFRIPLYTILQNPKMEAHFLVNRPIILFGYFTLKTSLFTTAEKDEINNVTNPLVPTYVSLNIILEPVINMSSESSASDYYPGVENSQFLIMGSSWLMKIKKNPVYGKRLIKLWGENIDGMSVFIPRFISPLKIPPHLENEKLYIHERVARFVSLIPFKSDSDHFNDLPDIWSTCQQFLDLRAGGKRIDH